MSLLLSLLPARWRPRPPSVPLLTVEVTQDVPMPSLLLLIPALLLSVPWETIVPLAGEVIAGRSTRDELVATIPPILDDCLDFDVLLPGPVGDLLEDKDGEFFARAVGWIADHAMVKAKRKARASTPITAAQRTAGAAFFAKLGGRHVQPATA